MATNRLTLVEAAEYLETHDALLELQSPAPSMTTSQLHIALNELVEAGLLAKYYDAEGHECFHPIGGEL
jgi:hypothetical protein